jgi:MFS family permease
LVTLPEFNEDMQHPTPAVLGLITSIYDIGALVGTILAAVYGMRFGRRWMIVAGCLFVVLGGALQASANSAGHMIAGRIIAVCDYPNLSELLGSDGGIHGKGCREWPQYCYRSGLDGGND